MTELFPVFFGTAMLLILSGLEVLFFRLLNPGWWKKKWIRIGSFFLPALGIIFITIWVLGIFSFKKTIMMAGATLTALDLVLIFALLLSLPVSGMFNLLGFIIEKYNIRKSNKAVVSKVIPRRRFLKGVAAVVPALALSTGLSGVAHAYSDIKVYKKKIYFDDLPPQLDGFKILHISDIHIGYYVGIEDVERVLEEAASYTPDIVLATGDLSDRLDVYPDLLRLLDQFNALHGVFASIGNHEYYRGFKTVLKIFDKSPVPLLLNSGATVVHRNYRIHIGGANDPRTMRRVTPSFYHDTISQALSNRPDGAFSILMSHRPDALDDAAMADVDLMLSGHTHGAQIGWAGRSVFEPIAPTAYLWGAYAKSRIRLYTSAGMGHWFPFRFGCPSEAPILELCRQPEPH
jgi:hypothetical protein